MASERPWFVRQGLSFRPVTPAATLVTIVFVVAATIPTLLVFVRDGAPPGWMVAVWGTYFVGVCTVFTVFAWGKSA